MRPAALIVTFVVLLHGISIAALPGGDDPKAFTEHDYAKSILDFHRRTLVETYRDAGKRDAKWDEPAIAFLDALGRYFTYIPSNPIYKPVSVPTVKELAALHKVATDAGCDDPLVAYGYTIVMQDEGRPRDEIMAALEPAVQGVLKGRYALARQWAASHRYFATLDDADPAKKQAAWKTFVELSNALLATWDFKGADRRIIHELASEWLVNDGEKRTQEWVNAVAANEKADAWIVHVMRGRRAINEAWDARGSGWANTVTEQGWREFERKLTTAREHLLAAHQLEPSFPEAAVSLIMVAMGNGAQPGPDMRHWFERALVAQIDYTPAYDRYLYALMPRWHGSHDAMFRVGVECADTKRFNTRIPWQLINALDRITRDDDVAFWGRAGVYEKVAEVCQGYAATGIANADWYRSLQAAVAWRANRFAESTTLIDQLGAKFDVKIFDRFKVMRHVALNHAYAMVDAPTAQRVTGGEAQVARNDLDGAIATYAAAIEAIPKDHKGRPFLAGRLLQLQWRRQFGKGEWVDIQPGKDLAGWSQLWGTWEVDRLGDLVGTFDEGGLALWLQAPAFTKQFIVEGVVEFDDTRCNGGGFTLSRGDPLGYSGLYAWRNKETGEASVWTHFHDAHSYPAKVEKTNTFRIAVDGGLVTYVHNDAEILHDHDVKWMFDNPKTYIGVGGRWGTPGAKVRFRSLRMRALKEKE